jgi:hypothetical protein
MRKKNQLLPSKGGGFIKYDKFDILKDTIR